MKQKLQLLFFLTLFGFITRSYSQSSKILVQSGASVAVDGNAEIIVNGGIENHGTIDIGVKGQVSSQNLSNETSGGEGIFNIKSDATGTGSLITNAGSNAIVNMQRYIGYDGFGEISAPTASTAQVLFDIGTFVQKHDETARKGGQPYINILSTDVLNPMEGYSVDINTAGSIVEFSGIINSGDQSYTLTSTNFGTVESPSYYGWNLVGNPYTSAIVWDSIVKDITNEKVNRTIYILDGHAQSWLTYNSSLQTAGNTEINTIPPGQGFFVQLLSTEGSDTNYDLTINNSHRVHNNDNINFGAPVSRTTHSSYPNYYLELNVKSETNAIDRAFYHWRDEATNEFDSKYDSYKMMSWSADIPNVYFYSGTTTTSIQQEPETETVKVGFSGGASSNFEFNVEHVHTFSSIILEDKQESTMTNLMEQSYSFTKGSDDNNRFIIHFTKGSLKDEENTLEGTKLFASNKNIHFSSLDKLEVVEIEIFDIQGRFIDNYKLDPAKRTHTISTQLNYGVYIVNVVTNKGEINKTLLIE